MVVPPAATSGPVRVVGSDQTGPTSISNALYFEVLDPTPANAAMRLAAKVPGPEGLEMVNVIAMSPLGDYAMVGAETGEVSFLDIDPESPTFNKIYKTAVAVDSLVSDIEIAPDGKRAFVVGHQMVKVIGANRLSQDFGSHLATVDIAGSFPGAGPACLAVRPDGELLLVGDSALENVYVVDIQPSSPNVYQIMANVNLLGMYGTNGHVWRIGFHPSGLVAYLLVRDENTNLVLVLDTDPGSASYLSVIAGTSLGGTGAPYPWQLDLSFTPDGNRCFVLWNQFFGAVNPAVLTFDCSNPQTPFLLNTYTSGLFGTAARDNIDVSPRGDRAVFNSTDNGFFQLDIRKTAPVPVGGIFDYINMVPLDQDYTPDASRFYVASSWADSVYIYDFNAASDLTMISGDEQTGVVNEPVAAPLRVAVQNRWEQEGITYIVPIPGAIVTFKVTEGGGYFTDYMTDEQSLATDENGIAEIDWTFGPVVGVQTQIVQVFAQGLIGSPVWFVGDSVEDPNTLPLTFGELLPLNGTPERERDHGDPRHVQPRGRSSERDELDVLPHARRRDDADSRELRFRGGGQEGLARSGERSRVRNDLRGSYHERCDGRFGRRAAGGADPLDLRDADAAAARDQRGEPAERYGGGERRRLGIRVRRHGVEQHGRLPKRLGDGDGCGGELRRRKGARGRDQRSGARRGGTRHVERAALHGPHPLAIADR